MMTMAMTMAMTMMMITTTHVITLASLGNRQISQHIAHSSIHVPSVLRLWLTARTVTAVPLEQQLAVLGIIGAASWLSRPSWLWRILERFLYWLVASEILIKLRGQCFGGP